MPFITDTAMQKVATKLQSFETREEKRKVEVRQKLNEAKTVAESSLGAALVERTPPHQVHRVGSKATVA